MKVALVLTGLLRCFDKAYPSFKQYVLDRYDTDVYFDIWSEIGYYTGKGYLPEENGFVRTAEGERGFHASGELIDSRRIFELYNPAILRVEDFNRFERVAEERAKQLVNAYTRPKNTICQAYKAIRGLDLLSYGPAYDLVIRARPDIVLEHDPGHFSPHFIYTLPSRNKMNKGTGDSFMAGSQKMVQAIHGLQYSNLEVYYNALGVSCPHMFIQYAIQQAGAEHIELGVGAHIAHSPRGIYQEPE